MSNSEKVYSKIKQLIFRGQIKPGERLIETELCEKFATSRTPVREALNRLSSEKFIKITPNKGAQVARMTLKEIEEVQEFRMLIETKCLAEFSGNISSDDTDELVRLHNEMKINIKEMDIYKFVENNALFHLIFIEISGNTVISQTVKDLQNRYYPHQYFTLTLPGVLDMSIQGHKEIVECFINKEFKQAMRSIRKHYEDFKSVYKKLGELNLI